jgi:Domain of unknown function (DUF5668)/Putative adhesin
MSPVLYRRGSFFWALILIAIGTIFLLQNFNPAIHPWEILAKYWPVLIIVWGVSKLIDYVQSRAHPEIVPPPIFSGADVVLLILILILGTLVSRLVLAPWHEWRNEWGIHWSDSGWRNPFLNSYTYTRGLSTNAARHLHFIIDNRRGDVEVQGTEASGINAVVRETIRAANDQDAAKVSRQLALAIVNQNGSYVLHPDFGLLPNGGDTVRLDIAVRVPRGTGTEITTRDGDILLSGLQGKQLLIASGGDIHVSEVEGAVQVEESGGSADIRSVKGTVEVSGHGGDVQVADASSQVTVNGEFTGLVRFRQLLQGLQFTSSRTQLATHNLAGKLEMQMGSLEAANVEGPLQISTSHKDINIVQFRSALTISDRGGNIVLQADAPPTQPIVVNSKNGDIQLTLPSSSKFVMDASSKKGQVDSDFSSASLVVRTQGEEPSIKGSYGNGGPPIHLFTTYGTVHLIRETAIPSQPTPGATEQTRLQPTDSELDTRS